MKIVHAGAFATTLAALASISHGYSFSDVSTVNEAPKESTGLTVNEESRIYGGIEANVDNWPFLASLRDPFFDETFCGGALIAPQYILTAGHCIKTDEMDVIATFGTNESSGSGSGEGVQIPVIEGFRHPMYKKKEHLYDVGLLKLKKPIKRKTAKLCARDGSDNEVGTMATVMGWGKTEDSSDMGSPVLEQLTIPVISNAECGKFEKYVDRVTEGMLCAGTGDGKDTCNGDSGGPLIVDKDILIGCVSWGSKCGEQAGIFTRLTYVMDYIEDILAGGDGSQFNVSSSSSGSLMDDVSLSSSQEGSYPDATMIPPVKATKAPEDVSSESASGSENPTESGSGSDSLSWMFGSDSGSDNLSWILDTFSGSGSLDLSWLFGSDEASGSDSDSSLSSASASEVDDVLVKGGKSAKAPKAKPTAAPKAKKSTKAPTEESSDESTSTSASTSSASASSSEDLVHQGDIVQQQSQ